jgi:hypothetical protein
VIVFVFVCTGYFLKDDTPEKQLFEHHQEMLEKNTERLHEHTEQALDSLDRTQIVNLTRVTEKFLSSLLNSITNGVVTLPNASENEYANAAMVSKHSDGHYGDDSVHEPKRVRSGGGSEAISTAMDEQTPGSSLASSPIAILTGLWRGRSNSSSGGSHGNAASQAK